MNVKKVLKRIPCVAQLYKTITTSFKTHTQKRIFKQLDHTSYAQGPKLKEMLERLDRALPPSEQHWITNIESERQQLLNRNEPLNDGSFEKGGLYDDNQTIKQACEVSKPPKPALMLFLLTRIIAPQRVIELGTNVGISSAYIGAALKVNRDKGKLITLDMSPYRQRLAKTIHHHLSIDNISYIEGFFADTLSQALEDMGSVDLAFIDGHHQYQPTLDYFEEILRFAAADAVFVFDDIRWSDDMKKAWFKIQSDERLGLIVDLFSVGICVRRRETMSQRHILQPLNVL